MNSKEKYSISDEAVKGLLSKLINEKSIVQAKNLKHILEIILSMPECKVDILINTILEKEEYIPFEIGQKVKYMAASYTSDYDKDVLVDKGLMTKEGFIFGTIIGDASWGDTNFNKYHDNMNINMKSFSNGKHVIIKDCVNSKKLIIINEFPDFKKLSSIDYIETDKEHELIKT